MREHGASGREHYTHTRYLPARLVCERYNVSEMTIYRWLRDSRMEFPKPYYFGRFRYWRVSELAEWERARAANGRVA